MTAELLDECPTSALAVYAHPDDADVGCGGTLARWVDAGCQVHLVVITDGGRGTNYAAVTPTQLARQRSDELAQAAKVIGLTSHHVLGWADGELDDAHRLLGEVVRCVREIRPEVVLGHDPTAVFFGQDYFNHRDHRGAGWALLDAVAPAAALPQYFPEAGPPHQVSWAYLSGTLAPQVWVDISATVERKVAAVECHRSQFEPTEGWAGEAVRRRAPEEGRAAGCGYAEGFRRIRVT